MEAETRIKVFLKDQIEKGNITRSELLKLKPENLIKVDALKDIDHQTISATLHSVKCIVDPSLLTRDLQQAVQQEDNPLADQINSIMKGYG